MAAEQIRLNKFISDSGFCSRREADQYIEDGRTTINGKTARMGATVKPGDRVAVDGETIKARKPTDRLIYIALNKPVGITSTTDTRDKNNIIDFVGYPKRIFPIGRLDNDSEGLILLTNNGDIINKILRAGNNHEKEYIVTVDKPLTAEFLKKMGSGVPIFDTVTKPCPVYQQGLKTFRIILTQGLNRQIRRMCEHLGYKVTQLKRVRIMNIKLGDMPVGNWRLLTKPEIDGINELVAESSKTEEASYDPYGYSERPVQEAKTRPERKAKPGKTKDEFVNPKSAALRKKNTGKQAGAEKRFSKPSSDKKFGKPAGSNPEKKNFTRTEKPTSKSSFGAEKRSAATPGKKPGFKQDAASGKASESRPKSTRPPKNPKGRQR